MKTELFFRFRDQFTKLILWKLTQYKAHIYFDADAFVVGNIDHLFKLPNKLNNCLGVTRDIRGGTWQQTFNMGVFIVNSNTSEFNRLIRLKSDPNFKFETTMSEQGFLNVVYENKWYEIGFEYNANLAAFAQDPKLWKEKENNIRVIHYTMNKPWECGEPYLAVCKKWKLF